MTGWWWLIAWPAVIAALVTLHHAARTHDRKAGRG